MVSMRWFALATASIPEYATLLSDTLMKYIVISTSLHWSSIKGSWMYIHDPLMLDQWRDVEITMYFMRVSDSNVAYSGMEAVARANHLIDTIYCDTRGSSARMRDDGHIDFEKETHHPYWS